MNLLDINIQSRIADIIDAYTKVYGTEYRDVIEKRMSRICYIMYNNVDGIGKYINFLETCKQKELGIKFLQEIGIDVSKYQGRSLAEDLDEDTNALLQEYIGGSYEGINSDKKHDPVGMKAWYPPKEKERPNLERIKDGRIKFINFLRGKAHTPITEGTFQEFCETDEYKELLRRIEGYLQIHEQLLEEYESYKQSQQIAPYQQYVDDETKRRDNLHKQQRLMLYEQISKGMFPFKRNYLPRSIKKFLDRKCSTVEEKSELFLGTDMGMKLYVEYFSQEDENKLRDSSVNQRDKDKILWYRLQYFKRLGVVDKNASGFYSNKDLYNNCLQQEGIMELVPPVKLVEKISQFRIERYKEFQENFIQGSPDFIRNMKNFDDTPSARGSMYSVVRNKEVCIKGRSDNEDFFPVFYYTVRGEDRGVLDFYMLHEISHVIEAEGIWGIALRTGFDGIGQDVFSANPYDIQKRKYERLNENITDILAIEAMQILHKQGIYILEPKEHVYEEISDTADGIIYNTSSITKDMLSTFMTRYRAPILQARIFGDMKVLYDIIGAENFEALNDVINKVDDMCINDKLPQKLKSNQKEEPLVVEYNKQLAKLEQIYADMEAYQSREGYQDDLVRSAVSATEETTRIGKIKDAFNNITQTGQKDYGLEQDNLEDGRDK